MINKILVWWGIALIAILVVENIVISNTAFLFIDESASAGVVILVWSIIWVWIWYWLSWFIKKKSIDDDDLDF